MNYNLALPLYRFGLEHPQQLAVYSDSGSVSYGELAGTSGSIATWLQHSVKGKPNRVGILASRSVEACAAVLGTCWAGGAYVPISLKLPEERLQAVLELSQLDALIVDSNGAKLLSQNVLKTFSKPIMSPDTIHELPKSELAPVHVNAGDIAYIIFTSGTTGVPKGVVVAAGSVHSLLTVMQQCYQIVPSDRVSENTDLSFDVSVSNMFMTWGAGATLYIVPPTQAMAPTKFIQDHRLTVWSSVPSIIGFMKKIKTLSLESFRHCVTRFSPGSQLL